jgi:DNA-binding MarR family transcriptional regulator
MAKLNLVEAAVLTAIAEGVDTVEGIAELLKVSREDAEALVEQLKAKGLIVEEEKRLLFIRRRRLRLTRAGLEALEQARRMLSEAASRVREAAERARVEGQPFEMLVPDEVLLILPVLEMAGLISLLELPLYLELLDLMQDEMSGGT